MTAGETLKRLCIWTGEIVSQAVGLSILLLSSPSDISPAGEIYKLALAIITAFVMSGYAWTTLVARLMFKSSRIWLYPVIAVLLSLIHFEVLNRQVGPFDTTFAFKVRSSSVVVVFMITILGSFALNHWRRGAHPIRL